MSVIFVGGVPGSGKTLFATYLMKKKFKKENFLRRTKINNVFSSYPIRLTDKRIYKRKGEYLDPNVYSRQCSLLDFQSYHKYIPDSVYVFDEIHTLWDSMDYKKFPRKISTTFQFHRHFGIKDIYVIAQHPARVVKMVRDLCDEFYKMRRFIKIPFIGVAIVNYAIYYNFDDYGKSVKVKKDDVIYDFDTRWCIFRYNKIFKSYDTKYMQVLVENEPYFESNTYNDLSLNMEQIKHNYNIDVKKSS